MKPVKDYYPAIALSLCIYIMWELIVRLHLISSAILPAPSTILNALFDNRSIIWDNALLTATEAIIGLIIACLLGILCGTALFLSSKFRKSTYPLLVVMQTIPLIALAPLLLVWFGFGVGPKIIIAVMYCFFPIAIAVSDGLSSADSQLVDLLKSMKASRWQTLRYVQMPSALPSFFSGLKISSTFAVTGAIIGEYVGAYQGLGIYMQSAAHSNAIDLVFASIFVIIGLSLILLCMVIVCEKICMPWKINN